MSLALGKNNVNAKAPLHLDATNHLLVNDSTNKAVLDQIATNTTSLNVNTDTLEALQTTTNNHLDGIIRHINNTNAIGDGSNALNNVPLGYDRGNGKGVALLVDANGRLSIDINSGLGLTRLTLTVLYSGLMSGNTVSVLTGAGSNSACLTTGFLVDLRLRVDVMFESSLTQCQAIARSGIEPRSSP